MEEIWKEWTKVDIPKREYELVHLLQNESGLRLFFEDQDIKIEVIYGTELLAVRSCDESERIKTTHTLLAAGGRYCLAKKLFFVVEHSKFKKWFIEETFHTQQKKDIQHHAFITSEDVIDVLALHDPEVRILKNNRDSMYGDYIIRYTADFESGTLVMETSKRESHSAGEINFCDVLTYVFGGMLRYNLITGVEESTIDAFLQEEAKQLAARKAEGWPVKYENVEELKRFLTEQKYRYIRILSSCGLSGWVLAKRLMPQEMIQKRWMQEISNIIQSEEETEDRRKMGIEERWKVWQKEDLPQGSYRLVFLFQGWGGLYLIFESHGIKVEIFYDWAFAAVRSRRESEAEKIRDRLLAGGGEDFLENKLLYIVEHSEFTKWLAEESIHIHEEEEFEHHIFVTENDVTDVLAWGYEPKVRIVKNDWDSICGDSIISYEADFVGEILEMCTRQKDSGRKRTIRFWGMLTYEFAGRLQHSEIAGIEECTIDTFLEERAEEIGDRKAEGWPIEYENMKELKEYLTEQKYKYIKILSSCGLSGWILAKCFEVR